MNVAPKGVLSLNFLRSAYPFQIQPTISIPDHSINAQMGNAVELDGVVPDPIAGGLYAQPQFIPHNQVFADASLIDNDAYVDGDLPTWTWDDDSTFDGVGQCFLAKHWGHQTIDFVWNSGSSPASTDLHLHRVIEDEEDYLQGFIAVISRSVYNKLPSGSNAYYDVRWVIDGDHYSVRVDGGGFAQFRTSPDGSTWKIVAANLKTSLSTMQTMGGSTPQEGQGQIPIEVLLLNGCLQVKFGGQTVPLQYRIRGLLTPAITEVQIDARCWTQIRAELHPLYFATDASMRSNPIGLGFNPDSSTPPRYRITGIRGVVTRESGVPWNVDFPTGASVTVTRVGAIEDSEQQYDLELINPTDFTYNGQDFSKRTVVVVRVTIHVDGIWDVVPADPANVRPIGITETTTFHPGPLTIRQTLDFELQNLSGAWSGQAGNIAVQLQLGYANPSTAYFPRFTGMCGNYEYDRPATNRARISFHCTDLLTMLEEQTDWTPPLMDGWNHYYAIAHLAQYAGISLDQMAFAALVPEDPFSSAGADPAPYFLPLGDGMRPWTPRNREMNVLALMDYIRKASSYMLFFDAQGFLRYEPWIPPELAPQKRLFTEGTTGISGEGLTEYFRMTLRSSVDDVRNVIVLLGIDAFDPRWSLLIEKREDTASIFAAPGFEPKNYIGYRKPFVWTDARFADPDFAAEAADRLYQILRIPGLDLTFECWMQPDLYPMEVIYIEEPTSGATGVPFYILSITNHWSYDDSGKQTIRSTIRGRFLL